MSLRKDPIMSIVQKVEIGPMSSRAILAEAYELVERAIKAGWMRKPAVKDTMREAEVRRILHGE